MYNWLYVIYAALDVCIFFLSFSICHCVFLYVLGAQIILILIMSHASDAIHKLSHFLLMKRSEEKLTCGQSRNDAVIWPVWLQSSSIAYKWQMSSMSTSVTGACGPTSACQWSNRVNFWSIVFQCLHGETRRHTNAHTLTDAVKNYNCFAYGWCTAMQCLQTSCSGDPGHNQFISFASF